MTPEPITENAHFNKKADIWSLGVIFLELLIDKRPFKARTTKRLVKTGKKYKIDYEADDCEEISIEALDFIEKMLVKEPAERLDAASLLKESWHQNKSVDDKFLEIRYECNELLFRSS